MYSRLQIFLFDVLSLIDILAAFLNPFYVSVQRGDATTRGF